MRHVTNFCQLIESCVDNFCTLIQCNDPEVLRGKSRSILTAINDIFPPPSITGHNAEEDPILLKKIRQGEGVWDTHKETLGWLFDGITRCMELPQDKVDKITAELKAVGRCKSVPHNRLEKPHGKLQHASLGMPVGKPLLGPMIQSLHPARNTVPTSTKLKQLLRQWRSLIQTVGAKPTHCKELVKDVPGHIGYCDAAKQGAGGVWFGGAKGLQPTVWRVDFPEDI